MGSIMKNVKIIFFDVDGTLIDMSKKQISERMLATLKALKKQAVVHCDWQKSHRVAAI